MARFLHATTLGQLDNAVVRPRIAVRAMFDTPFYIWTGSSDLNFLGVIWHSDGGSLAFDGFDENSDLGATGISMSLALSTQNITADILDRLVNDDYQGKAVEVYLALVDEAENVQGSLVSLFDGFVDLMTVVDDGEVARITMSAESSLLKLQKVNTMLFTDQEQRDRFSSDTGLQYVSAIQEKKSIWGSNA